MLLCIFGTVGALLVYLGIFREILVNVGKPPLRKFRGFYKVGIWLIDWLIGSRSLDRSIDWLIDPFSVSLDNFYQTYGAICCFTPTFLLVFSGWLQGQRQIIRRCPQIGAGATSIRNLLRRSGKGAFSVWSFLLRCVRLWARSACFGVFYRTTRATLCNFSLITSGAWKRRFSYRGDVTWTFLLMCCDCFFWLCFRRCYPTNGDTSWVELWRKMARLASKIKAGWRK